MARGERTQQEIVHPGEQAAAWLAPGGPVARFLAGYEARPQQLEMARLVGTVLAESGVGIIEAGTGTGKSLAYLAPAAAYARAAGKRVIVSTHTINLQEQLLTKDVPLLQRALADAAPFRAAVLKGWTNYVCWLRLEHAGDGQLTLFGGEGEQLRLLRRWAEEGGHGGSRDELPFPVADTVWEDVQAEPDTCVRSACPFFEDCFVFRARRRAQEADIVIANHHLVCADAAIRRQLGWDTDIGVLPSYGHIIFDEAHHLEDVATDHFGLHFTRTRIQRLLSRIMGTRGLLKRVQHALAAGPESQGARQVADLCWRAVPEASAAVHDAAEGLFEYLAALAREADPSGEGAGQGEEALELSPGQIESRAWRPAADALEQLGSALKSLAEAVHAWRSGDAEGELLAKEAEALSRRAVNAAGDLVELADAADGRYVYWLERTGARRAEYGLRAAPVEAGELLQDALFRHVKAAVLTSATLSAGDDFGYFKERVGLAGLAQPVVEASIPSPFDYQAQVLLGMPDDLPSPDEARFEPAFAAALLRWLEASAGRAFVLFTSYRMLEAVYDQVAEPLRRRGLLLLRQGDESRTLLLQRFRAGPRAVLFGTDSFWEGVDVPGDALSLVVIARLPFRVPTDPVEKARAEAVAARGGDPFAEYSLPRAVMKFRQGFGRLIRTKTDKGAVVIADVRVHQRSYGRRFLAALPPCRTLQADSAALAAALKAWLSPAR